MKNSEIRRRAILLIQSNKYNISDFWEVCPYGPIELHDAGRVTHAKIWRQVGMTWATLSGENYDVSGAMFGRDHATCLHGVKCVADAIEMGYTDYTAIVNTVKDRAAFVMINATDGYIQSVYSLETSASFMMPQLFL